MRRRDFVTLVGGAAAFAPLAVRAQTMPTIGYIGQGTADGGAPLVAAVRVGLREVGLSEGKDFTSEIRWADNDAYRLPELISDLIRHRAIVIITLGTVAAARAAKAATTEIPVVFALGTDPVQAGLVSNLNHPGANITGISTMSLDLGEKWVALMHELLPSAKRFSLLINIENAESARALIIETQKAAFSLGIQNEIVFASSKGEIEEALSGIGKRSQALIIQPEVLFLQNLDRIATLTIQEKLPALYALREFPQAGGMMSYGSSLVEAHHQAGIYAGRILKGEKVGDLPVQRATKFNFVINLKTAKAIGVLIPPTLLAQADEVIE